jgi:uncharacterized membrane protein
MWISLELSPIDTVIEDWRTRRVLQQSLHFRACRCTLACSLANRCESGNDAVGCYIQRHLFVLVGGELGIDSMVSRLQEVLEHETVALLLRCVQN